MFSSVNDEYLYFKNENEIKISVWKKSMNYFMFIKKCFDINVMIKMFLKKCIYRFKYFLYLYIRIIGGSVDFIRVIFVVILVKGNMYIFKYKYIFVFFM